MGIHSNFARTEITYGKIPNYKYTWDYNKVWGCQCDQDYTGYDCSLRLCPKGDDPITGNGNGPLDPIQVKEIQTISCLATSGTFRLRFRNFETYGWCYVSRRCHGGSHTWPPRMQCYGLLRLQSYKWYFVSWQYDDCLF